MQTTFSVEFTDAVFGILNEFDLKFPNVRELGECVESLSDELILFSIRELKHMADLLKKVVTPLPSPKRNSKLSLSKWVAEVLLDATATVIETIATETSECEAYFASPDTEWIASYPVPEEDSDWCKFSSCSLDVAIKLVSAGTLAFDDDDDDDYPRDTRTLAEIRNECLKNGHSKHQEGAYPWIIEVDEDGSQPEPLVPIEPEILPVEQKPIFEIALLGDDSFTKHWVSQTPPYLVTKDGNLFHATGAKQTSPTIVIHYVQLLAEHLSNIQEGLLGTDIQLFSDNLSVASHNINGVPPLYLITQEGGVYQRMRRELIKQNSVVKYHQLVSEYLSNIEVVK